MRRCFDLARLAAGRVSPNPMVGAVIVHEGRILGEGWHKKYGNAHAEVEAFRSVATNDLPKIPDSTLFVSLEPCCIHHNTPACTDLILRERFKRVVISVRDPHPEVSGKGVEILKKAGIEVVEGVLAEEGRRLIAPQRIYREQKRPYILLKYAQSANGFMGLKNRQVPITGALSKRMVHRWRAESDAILIGSGTFLSDTPLLTNRLWFGESPLRILLDRKGRLFHVMTSLAGQEVPTLLFSAKPPKTPLPPSITWLPYPEEPEAPEKLMRQLAARGIRRLLVEGGAQILKSFLKAGLWDEIRLGTGAAKLPCKTGEKDLLVPAPQLPPEAQWRQSLSLETDRWDIYTHHSRPPAHFDPAL